MLPFLCVSYRGDYDSERLVLKPYPVTYPANSSGFKLGPTNPRFIIFTHGGTCTTKTTHTRHHTRQVAPTKAVPNTNRNQARRTVRPRYHGNAMTTVIVKGPW